MPTYQYRCTNCGHEIEAVQKFSDPALTTCDQCQGTLRKVFSPVGVVFKGSGFYATDSRSKKTASSSAGTTSATNESSSTSTSDAATPASTASSTSTSSASTTSTPSSGTASGTGGTSTSK